MPNIDDLSIEITSNANKATHSIDTLIKGLSSLSRTLGQINATNTKGISSVFNSLTKLSNSNVGSLTSANLGEVGKSIFNLTNSLSSVPKVQQSTTALINAVGNLSKSGDKIPLVTQSLDTLAVGLTKFINTMSFTPNLSESTIRFSQAIATLGSSGAKVRTTASNLEFLGVELKKLMSILGTAPTVSDNVIQMTNAIASLASQGRSTGSATRALQNNFNALSESMNRLNRSSAGLGIGIRNLKNQLLGALGVSGGIYSLIKGIKSSINLAADLAEVQNVIDVSFGQYKNLVEEFSSTSIQDYGMSELTAKQISGRYQAMGTSMGFARGEMAEMSIELTKLAADLSSFYNVSQERTAQALQSVFTGETEPMRAFGVSLDQATLKEWALKNGLDANISAMTQAEKAMLRYQYVIATTSNVQGDYARTASSFSNSLKLLKQQFAELGSVMGQVLINALQPVIRFLNSAMEKVIEFAKTVASVLGEFLGWEFNFSFGSGVVNDLDMGATYADDLSSGLGSAVGNAKKLRQQLQGFDELNVLNSDQSGGGGVGGMSGLGNAFNTSLIESTNSLIGSTITKLEQLQGMVGSTSRGNEAIRKFTARISDGLERWGFDVYEDVYEALEAEEKRKAHEREIFQNAGMEVPERGKGVLGGVAYQAQLEIAKDINLQRAFADLGQETSKAYLKADKTLKLFGVDTKKLGNITAESFKQIANGNGIFETMSTALPEYADVITNGVSNRFNQMSDNVTTAITWFAEGALGSKANNALTNFASKNINTTNAVNSAYQLMANGITGSMIRVEDGSIQSTKRTKDGVLAELANMRNGSNSTLDTLNRDTTNKFAAIKNNAIAQLVGLSTGATNQFASVNTGATRGLAGLGTTVTNAMAKAKAAITNESWYTPGVNLVGGLQQGITNQWNVGLTTKVLGLANNLTSTLKKGFGIHSPSRIWRDEIGSYLTQGLEVGILGEESHLQTSIASMGARLTNTMSGALTLATPSSLSSNYDFGVTSTMAHNFSADGSMSSNIAQGVRDGVYSAQSEQNALLREQNNLLLQILNKEGISMDDVYSGVVNRNRDNINRTGLNPMMAY